MSNLDTLLNDIINSVKATKTSIDNISEQLDQPHPELISSLVEKSPTSTVEGVSLLQLKNQALLSYINNIALVVLGQVAKLEDEGSEKVGELWDESVKRSIVQRVTLEKGVKPLEKKIGYQLDKMVRAYTRMEEDEQKIENKLNNRDEDGSSSEEEEEEDSEEEDDKLAYRPDASSLAKLAPRGRESKTTSETSNEKYVAPKISAMAPPSAIPKEKPSKTKKLQSMEEYLQDQSDLPTAEASIGSTIVDHGRGGVKTSHDRKKESEIQTYEENNFIRLPSTQTKKSFKQKQRDMANQFAGEDWSIFNNNDREVSSGTSRKRKPTSAWDRVKKRRN
ncbi:U3 small nucleolar ribonucleoprotein LCP5 [Spathaspora sp. JA1]|nr:U3 small nucleolar ribonucleoprotein LCP5 [Spathaspora sp. JA1]